MLERGVCEGGVVRGVVGRKISGVFGQFYMLSVQLSGLIENG